MLANLAQFLSEIWHLLNKEFISIKLLDASFKALWLAETFWAANLIY